MMPFTGPLLIIAALIYRAQSDLYAILTDEKDIASHLHNDEPSTENSCTQTPSLDHLVRFWWTPPYLQSLQQELQRHRVIGFN